MAGYVYLVWAKGTDMYKIGSTGYPSKRLSQLQTGSPTELELVAEREFEDQDRQEKLMHDRWAKFRSHGEWFKFHPLKIPQVLSGFNLMDRWSHDRLNDEWEAARKALKAHAEKAESILIKASFDAIQKCSEDLLAEKLPITERKTYESIMHLHELLKGYLPESTSIEVVKRQCQFEQELSIIACNILG